VPDPKTAENRSGYQRWLTAIVGIPIALFALMESSGWALLALCAVAFALAAFELCTILSVKHKQIMVGVCGVIVGVLTAFYDPQRPWLALFALPAFVVSLFLGSSLRLLYVALPLALLLPIHGGLFVNSGWHLGANDTLLAVLPLWAGDSAAYFVGKKLGKHALAPKISPKKSWEGAIANFLACIAISLALMPLLGHPWWLHALAGALCGVFGQMGDLYESKMKREAGVKDSGSLLPGHGGLLDRIDSLLFSAVAVGALLFATR